MSIIGFCSAGIATPASRVQGKFSSHEACEATGSICFAFSQVCGAIPPVVPLHLAAAVAVEPFKNRAMRRDVAAVAVHDQDAAEAGAHDPVEDVLHDRAQRRDLAASPSPDRPTKLGVNP